MQKYMALIVAVLLMIVTLLAGLVQVLPAAQVSQIIQLIIAYILGHVTSLGTLHYAEYLDRRNRT